MSDTRVVRLKRRAGAVVQGCDVYIGRACTLGGWNLPHSKWANPFTVKDCGSADIAVAKYRVHVLSSPHLLEDLHELRGKVLGCWCKPGPCHGDVLKELVDAKADGPQGSLGQSAVDPKLGQRRAG